MRNIHLNQSSDAAAEQRPGAVGGWTLAPALILAGSLLACGGEAVQNPVAEPDSDSVSALEPEELTVEAFIPPGAYGQRIQADFNRDGKTDLLIVTASGSYVYLARGNGQFQPNVYVRHDLPLGKVQYTLGDFDGDGRTDLLIVTASGSYEYLAVGNGQFRPDVYVRHDLPLGNVQYVPGDANGNYGSPYMDWLITTCRSSDHGYRDYSAAFRSTT